ncbi:hypothetical protein M422DRAFT_778288 [Sphaerobolus stellatus SS14]|uniref:Unplaced genomic scaffold SPHSTscaffold_30, whole genome shotgun sequence n=1 Tax=Sphaerobolus stellatus (strain SS14) TaxID=990650 RepID=A0A0C9W523_SPHS4|nr:hypothetical protein M422DRAFT_778288 [Sphaerobolus stellatus SS14]
MEPGSATALAHTQVFLGVPPSKKRTWWFLDLITMVLAKLNRWKFSLGLAGFVLVEAGFFALCFWCLKNPVTIVPGKVTEENATSLDELLKQDLSEGFTGNFTVFFNTWQTVAITLGGIIIAETFAKEWSTKINESATFEDPKSREVLRVSSPSADHKVRLAYFFKTSPTASFRIAFLASLAMAALHNVAPGAITADEPSFSSNLSLPIGIFLDDFGDDSDSNTTQKEASLLLSLQRSALIVNTEHVEFQPFGYKVPNNAIAGWPVLNIEADDLVDLTLTYPSDIIHFKHNCHWEKPQFGRIDEVFPIITAGGVQWDASVIRIIGSDPDFLPPDNASSSQPYNASSIQPLFQIFETTSDLSPKSAYLFLGGNNTIIKPDNKTSYAIDLSGLPTFYNAAGIQVSAFDLAHVDDTSAVAPLATVLVCEPQPLVVGGMVSITGNELSISSTQTRRVNNISPNAVNLLFAFGLYQSIVEPDPVEGSDRINFVATQIFMSDSKVNWARKTGQKPLDLDIIGDKMDNFTVSAAKGLALGQRTTSDDNFDASNATKNVTANCTDCQIQVRLVANRGPLFSAIALFAAILPLLIILQILDSRHPERLIFNAENILGVFHRFGDPSVLSSVEKII